MDLDRPQVRPIEQSRSLETDEWPPVAIFDPRRGTANDGVRSIQSETDQVWPPSTIASPADLAAPSAQISPNGGPESARAELDGAILKRAQRGERAALEAFVFHYEKRLFAFLHRAMGHDCSVPDLAQDVFLRAIQALPRFELGRAKLSTWLFQIAVHRVHDERRDRRREEPADLAMSADEKKSPEASATESEAVFWMKGALAQLPDDQRVALVLFEFHELSITEVAEITDTPEATIKTRIFRAKQKILEAYRLHSEPRERGAR